MSVIKLNLKVMGNDRLYDIEVPNDIPIEDLRVAISDKIDLHQDIKLIFCGKVLKNGTLLSSYNIRENQTIQILPQRNQQQNAQQEAQPQQQQQNTNQNNDNMAQGFSFVINQPFLSNVIGQVVNQFMPQQQGNQPRAQEQQQTRDQNQTRQEQQQAPEIAIDQNALSITIGIQKKLAELQRIANELEKSILNGNEQEAKAKIHEFIEKEEQNSSQIKRDISSLVPQQGNQQNQNREQQQRNGNNIFGEIFTEVFHSLATAVIDHLDQGGDN